MYIVYSNGCEVIVCTVANEKKTVQAFFTEGGRDLEEYDRKEVNDMAVSIVPRLWVD